MPEAPKEIPRDPEVLLQEVAQSGLSKFLRDTDLANRIATAIAEETGVARWKIQLGLRVLTPVVVSLAEAGGTWLGDAAKQRAYSFLKRFTWCDNLLKWLKDFSDKTRQQAASEKALKAYLEERSTGMPVDGAKELSLEVQTQILTQGQLEELAADLKKGMGNLDMLLRDYARFLNPQPLFKAMIEPDERAKFVYRSRFIPFVPRDAETAFLEELLLAPGRFRWQVLTGPGGGGKSRLALEFCRRIGGAARAGILTDLAFDFKKWQPDRPALLVVDYASTDKERLREVLRTLAHREADLDYPVRMLLLDRGTLDTLDTPDKFFEELAKDHDLRQRQFEATRPLPPLGDNGLWDIMLHFFKKAEQPPTGSREEHLKRLRNIDPQARPLFAAYYGDAMARGHFRKEWDRQSLLRDVIRREKEKYWVWPFGEYSKKSGSKVTNKDEALLALATVIRGVHSLHANLPPFMTTMAEIVQDQERFMALGGGAIPNPSPGQGGPEWIQVIPPWEPDLVGELFVLDFLRLDGVTKANLWARPLLDAAWGMNPAATAVFINRAAQEHPSEVTAARLLARPPENAIGIQLWHCVLAGCITHLLQAGKLDEAQTLYAEIAALAKAHPGNEDIFLTQANVASLCILFYRYAEEVKKDRTSYDSLAAMVKRHPGYKEIALVREKFIIFNDQSNAENLNEARKLYDSIAALAKEHPGNEEIALVQAKEAFNFFNDQFNAGNMDEARKLYDSIAALAKEHPGNEEIALKQAKGAVNLIPDYGNAGKLDEARALYDSIASLAKEHPGDMRIALRQAKGAFNLILILAYGNAGDLDEARKLLNGIAGLAAKHPYSEEVALRQAQGAVNLILAYENAGNLDEACALYDSLAALAQKHPDNEEIALAQAQGVVNCIVYYSNVEKLDEARELLDALDGLAKAHPDDDEIALAQARGAVNLIVDYEREGNMEEAERLQRSIVALAEQHPDNDGIAQILRMFAPKPKNG